MWFQSYLTGIEIEPRMIRERLSEGSNRTLLELKYYGEYTPFFVQESSNRTLLELKFANAYGLTVKDTVPIVPYWN